MLIPHKGNNQRIIAATTAPLSKPVAMLSMTYPFMLISAPLNQPKRAPATAINAWELEKVEFQQR